MTEGPFRDLVTAIATERDARMQHARACEDAAALGHSIHDFMAEWMLAAAKGIPIPDKAIAAQRLRLSELIDRIVNMGNEDAASAIALARRIGPAKPGELPPDLADTNPDGIDIAEVAAAKDD